MEYEANEYVVAKWYDAEKFDEDKDAYFPAKIVKVTGKTYTIMFREDGIVQSHTKDADMMPEGKYKKWLKEQEKIKEGASKITSALQGAGVLPTPATPGPAVSLPNPAIMMAPFDRKIGRSIGAAILSQARCLELPLGVTFKFVGGRIAPDIMTLKIEVAKVVNGVSVSKEAADFKAYCHRYGMKASDLGRLFRIRGRGTYELVGCMPRSYKYPIIGRIPLARPGKGLMKFAADKVLKGLV